jgi:acyl-CoA thioesterase-1
MKYNLNILFLSLCAAVLFSCNGGNGNATEEAVQRNTPEAEATDETATEEEKVILFFGNSLTAGYGLDDPSKAFPGLIQQRLDSLGYSQYKAVNAGLSGETTASGKNRLDWVLERQPVDIFVLELGANDGLRGVNPEETRRNLEEMIEKVRKASPNVEVILAGMLVPPSMGPAYSKTFSQVFPQVAEEKEVALIPFLLENVAGEPELNQGDGVHPTAEGQKILADNVWAVLKDKLEEPEKSAAAQ